ncbi:MAG TPA: multiheme c-type cytochrome [Vicinamibacterales bacterium]|nr:multiheme c-type cytochrome [Vicinamibacterales bacterium]
MSRAVLIVAVLGIAAGMGLAAVSFNAPSVSERQITNRPIQVDNDGYVSSRTCQACHPSQYETWRSSYHRTMTQVATPETVRPDFDGQRVNAVHGRPMLLQHIGRELWAEFDDPEWEGAGTPARINRQVVMTTGSHHQQVFWYRTDRGRQLGQLPGTYIIAERRWVPRRMVFLYQPLEWPPSATGTWNSICIDCHTTHGKSGVGETTALSGPDTTVAEFGIACEACHGPSSRHVHANQSPARRYWLHLTGQRDSTTVQPAMLDTKASSQVCGQCHGVWLYTHSTSGPSTNYAGLPYRPGDEILNTRVLVRPADPASPALTKRVAEYPGYLEALFWSDGMIRVSGREYNGLVDSPCFVKATEPQNRLSCFSCHTMHEAPGDPRSNAEWAATHQVSVKMGGNEACLQCHPRFRTNLAAHTRHQEGSPGSSCYNCHMPYTTYGLLKGVRSNQISSPTVSASVQTGRPNACNLCHLDKSLGWTSNSLEKWYGTKTVALSDDQQTIAASLLWLMRGDAGQRALMAWAMGWQPAQQASGADWLPPFLSGLFDDPYDAVRFIAFRSMRSLPGLADFKGDFLAPASQRRADVARILDMWRRAQASGNRRTDAALLLNPDGSFKLDIINRLVREQDTRAVNLNE